MKKKRALFGAMAALALMVGALVGFTGTAKADDIAKDATANVTLTDIETGAGADAVKAYAYKIIDVNWDGQQYVEPGYTWTSAVAKTVKKAGPDYIDENGAVTDEFNSDLTGTGVAKSFYDKLAAQLRSGEADATATAAEGNIVFKDLPMGSYLVLITNSVNRVYQPVVVNVTPEFDEATGAYNFGDAARSVTQEVKWSPVSLVKTITDAGTLGTLAQDGKSAAVMMDATVSYQLLADLPNYPASAAKKLFEIVDVTPAEVDFVNGTVKVYASVDGNTWDALTADTNYTLTFDANARSFTVAVKYDTIAAKAYSKVKVTYDGRVNQTAVAATNMVNTATLSYNNDPYNAEGLATLSDSALVATGGAEIVKVDAKDAAKFLAGAEFKLATKGGDLKFSKTVDGVYKVDANGSTTLVTAGDKGLIKIDGLAPGTYTLTETKAPAGYVLPSNSLELVVKDTTGYAKLTVTNSKGFSLPTTGGAGTIALTVAGVVVMAGAGLMLARGRKGHEA